MFVSFSADCCVTIVYVAPTHGSSISLAVSMLAISKMISIYYTGIHVQKMNHVYGSVQTIGVNTPYQLLQTLILLIIQGYLFF